MQTLNQLSGVGSHNRNDCFVQSLTNATMQPYGACMRLAIKSGWTTSGIDVVCTFHALRNLGFSASVYGSAIGAKCLRQCISVFDYDDNRKSITLGKWLASDEAQSGTFIVGIRRHVLCIRDGMIFDAHRNNSLSRINAIFKLN